MMNTLIAIISGALLLFLFYLLSRHNRGRYVPKPIDYSLLPSSPFYGWKLEDLDHEDTLVPWDEVFCSKQVNSEELGYDSEHIVVVDYRSPQHTWDHLAGRAGYLLIDVKQRKQIDLLITMLN